MRFGQAPLQLAAASASTLWLPRSAWSQPHLPGNPFTLGVASGWPTPEGGAVDAFWPWATLGQQLAAPSAITVRWEVAHDSALVAFAIGPGPGSAGGWRTPCMQVQ